MHKDKILIIDDSNFCLKKITKKLGDKYSLEMALGGKIGADLIAENNYDLILTSLKMKDFDGMFILKKAREQNSDTYVIIMTRYASVETAVDCLKKGAFDYIQKPLDTNELRRKIQSALKNRIQKKTHSGKSQNGESVFCKKIISQNYKMKELFKIMDIVAMNKVNVLIEGESGTGKELVARYIHYRGQRANKPFIAVNCTAIPESLLESELFGYKKGSFTGALHDKKGLIEEAEGGTFLLDEIGDMSVALQGKLLRFLQERTIRKVGGSTSEKVDVRIISSTNQNLRSLIRTGKFRDDLYYRLKVVPILLIPLRKRRDDIRLLLNHFINKLALELNEKPKKISDDALLLLEAYHWPGNVRELENLVECLIALNHFSETITSNEIKKHFQNIELEEKEYKSESDEILNGLILNREKNMKEKFSIVEKNCIVAALEKNNWNQMKASKELGIGRTTLWRRINSMNIKRSG